MASNLEPRWKDQALAFLESAKGTTYLPELSPLVSSVFRDYQEIKDRNPIFGLHDEEKLVNLVVTTRCDSQNAYLINYMGGDRLGDTLFRVASHYEDLGIFRVITYTTNVDNFMKRVRLIPSLNQYDWYLEETVAPMALPNSYEYNTDLLMRKLWGEDIYILSGVLKRHKL